MGPSRERLARHLPHILLIGLPFLCSVISIFYNPCVFGMSFFIDICYLDLRHSLYFVWTGFLLTLLLLRVWPSSFKPRNGAGASVFLSILLIPLALALSYGTLMGFAVVMDAHQKSQAKHERELAALWKEAIDKDESNLFIISDYREIPNYDHAGKVESIDYAFKIASKVPVRASIWVNLVSEMKPYVDITTMKPSGLFEPNMEAKNSVLLDSKPRLLQFHQRIGNASNRNVHFRKGSFVLEIMITARAVGSDELLNQVLITGDPFRGQESDAEPRGGRAVKVVPELRTREYRIEDFKCGAGCNAP